MATLSGGHLAVDFASGAVPALLPFFVLEFDLSYTATAVLMLAVLASSSCSSSRSSGSGPTGAGRPGSCPGRRAGGRRDRLAAVAPSYVLVLVLAFLRGDRDRRVPPRGREVRRVRERAKARVRNVDLQHRREHGLCARADRRDAARPLARAHRRAGRDAAGRSSSPCCSSGRCRPCAGSCRPPPCARRAVGQRRRPRDDPALRRDRPSQRRLVRPPHVRPALGRRERGQRRARETASSR